MSTNSKTLCRLVFLSVYILGRYINVRLILLLLLLLLISLTTVSISKGIVSDDSDC